MPIVHTRDRKGNEKCMMDKKIKSSHTSQWKKRSTVHKEEKKKYREGLRKRTLLPLPDSLRIEMKSE